MDPLASDRAAACDAMRPSTLHPPGACCCHSATQSLTSLSLPPSLFLLCPPVTIDRFCLDRPQFGGPNALHKACERRACARQARQAKVDEKEALKAALRYARALLAGHYDQRSTRVAEAAPQQQLRPHERRARESYATRARESKKRALRVIEYKIGRARRVDDAVEAVRIRDEKREARPPMLSRRAYMFTSLQC